MRAGMEMEAGGSDLDWIWEGEGGGGDWEKGARVSWVDEDERDTG